MRILRALTIVLIAGIAGIIIHSCCEGYAYKWAYIISENLNENNRRDNRFEDDTIAAEDFGIRIQFFEQKLFSHVPSMFMNEMYATSCRASFPVEDSIMDIRIITMQPFNTSTAAGEDVSEYFHELYHQHSIEEEVKRINMDDWSVIDFIDLVAIDSTMYKSEHQFIVNVHLSDNRIMSDTTEPVIIN